MIAPVLPSPPRSPGMSRRSLFHSTSAFVVMAAFVGIGFTQTQGLPTVASTPAGGQPACCNGSKSTQPLSGIWFREFDGTTITATLGGDELKLCISQKTGPGAQSVTFITDYTLTRDGLVHGVITGVDFTSSPEATSAAPTTIGRKMMTLHGLIDHPFSFRTRMTSAGLMVSNVKFAMEDMDLKDIINQFCGMYKQSIPKLQEVPIELNKYIAPAGASVVEAANPDKNVAPTMSPCSGQQLAIVLNLDKTKRVISLKECINLALKQNIGDVLTQPQYDRDIKVNNLVVNVETAYWNLLAAYHNLFAQEDALRQAFLGCRFTKARIGTGTELAQNEDMAKGQFERFRRNSLDARGTAIGSERQLRGLLGLPGEDGMSLIPGDEPKLTFIQPDFQEAAKEAMANRPELVKCRQDVQWKQLKLSLAKCNVDGLGQPISTAEELADKAAKLKESQGQLRDTEMKVMEFLVRQYRQVIQTHADIAPARAERETLQIYLSRIDTLIARGKWNPQDFQNYLTAQQQLATAIATEHQAIASYNIALAAFEFAKGTIRQQRNVTDADAEKALGNVCVPAPMPRQVEDK